MPDLDRDEATAAGCVTHHCGCACREERLRRAEEVVRVLALADDEDLYIGGRKKVCKHCWRTQREGHAPDCAWLLARDHAEWYGPMEG